MAIVFSMAILNGQWSIQLILNLLCQYLFFSSFLDYGHYDIYLHNDNLTSTRSPLPLRLDPRLRRTLFHRPLPLRAT